MMTSPTLLIVDDEQMLLDVLVEELEPLNYRLLVAHNGREALEIVQKENPDAILSDINMPKMNGFELLQNLRQMKLNIPFIFLTGFGDKERAITAIRLGALDFLEKPFDKQLLRSAVVKAVELGVELRNLNEEVDLAVKDSKVPADQLEELKERKKAVLIMKKQDEVEEKIQDKLKDKNK